MSLNLKFVYDRLGVNVGVTFGSGFWSLAESVVF